MKKFSFKLIIFLAILGTSSLLLHSCKTAVIINNHPANDTSLASEKKFYETYSIKLGIKLNGSEDKNLIKEVYSWIGTPYKYGGADHNGTDCSGFTMMVYKNVYNKSLNRSAASQVENTNLIDINDVSCGDLIFFKISGNKVSHVGLFIADNKFAHASSSRGVVINDLNENYYKKYFYSAGRIK